MDRLVKWLHAWLKFLSVSFPLNSAPRYANLTPPLGCEHSLCNDLRKLASRRMESIPSYFLTRL